MSSDPKKNQTPAAPATQKVSPEDETAARIDALQKQVAECEKRLRTSQGKITNRDPHLNMRLKKENAELLLRQTALERALFALAIDSIEPRRAEDETLQYEILRKAAVDFCKKANIDPELWKSIVS